MEENYNKIRRASIRSAIISIFGFLIIIASLIYSSISLYKLNIAIEEKEKIISIKSVEIQKLNKNIKKAQYTQNSLLDFLVTVTDNSNIHLLDPSVDWKEVKKQLDSLQPGYRKNAILNAILLAWKDIPFNISSEDVVIGFDSPRFLHYVLSTVDIDVKNVKGKNLSSSMMKQFKKVDNPKPGDLVFFKGQVGCFGFILASVGKNDSDHVGIGTLQKIAPLQIISLGNINTPYFPLEGYFRVIYPDEIP